MVAFSLYLMDETELVYASIDTYIWGVRNFMKLQFQLDPVKGIPYWDEWMQSVKVLSYVPAEPRQPVPLEVIKRIVADADPTSFEDVQFVNFMIDLLLSFSRSECPCPKTFEGRDNFDPERHWGVRDFDIRVMEGKRVLCIRFRAIKQDRRVQRPEAAGDGDWCYLCEVPGSDLCPVEWAMKLQSFYTARRDPKSPYFVARDMVRAYTYGAASVDFKDRQRRVGVPEDELTGLHGLRVTGYNETKRGLGEDLAVAHGLWKSTAHKRYDRFKIAQVLRIPAAIVGDDSGDGGNSDVDVDEPPQVVERSCGPPSTTLQRLSQAHDAAGKALEGALVAVENLRRESTPPGWHRRVHVASGSSRRYYTYVSAEGKSVRSSKVAWATYYGERSQTYPEDGDDESSSADESGEDSEGDNSEVLGLLEVTAASAETYNFAGDVAGSSYVVDVTRCDNPQCTLRREHLGGHSFELGLDRSQRRARPPSATMAAAGRDD